MVINKKSIEKGSKRFLLKSKDPFLLKDCLKQLREALSDYQYHACNDTESFSEVCGSRSLFGAEKRIIVLSAMEKENLDALLELVESPTDDILVLIETETFLKTKVYTTLRSLCNVIELKTPTEGERAVWVKTWMTEAGLSFSDEVPGYIASSGADLGRLRKEIKKLSVLMYTRGESAVTKDICNEVMVLTRESQFFVFMENFFKKKIADVLGEFSKVDEYSYVKLLHFMIGQIEKVYKVAVYKEQGLGHDDIGDLIGVPSFIVKTKLFTALSFYGKTKLLLLYDLLNKLDVELRTTKYPKDIVFEAYLVKAFKL